MLSILLPSYNNKCLHLVETLQAQASCIDGLDYEIIVVDDGGTDFNIKKHNSAINDLPCCRYIIRDKNVGRSAIRNYLATQAKGDWLLFIDSDITVDKADYLQEYYNHTVLAEDKPDVIYGGVLMIDDDKAFGHCLRYRYERAEAHNHTAKARTTRPYASFRTTNFIIRRSLFEQITFDERFVNYGYEDVMFGKRLKENSARILHLDNQVTYTDFESNAAYIKKIEQAMHTLYLFSNALEGYSPIIAYYKRLKILHLLWAVKAFYWLFYPMLKLNLLSRNPSLMAFKIYKLGYFMEAKASPGPSKGGDARMPLRCHDS